MTCDHKATTASLPAFLLGATFYGFEVLVGDRVLAKGTCHECGDELAVSVALARGHSAHEEIEADTPRPIGAGKTAETLEMRMAEMERHAEEIIK